MAVSTIKRSFMVVASAQDKLTELIITEENNVQFIRTHTRERMDDI